MVNNFSFEKIHETKSSDCKRQSTFLFGVTDNEYIDVDYLRTRGNIYFKRRDELDRGDPNTSFIFCLWIYKQQPRGVVKETSFSRASFSQSL